MGNNDQQLKEIDKLKLEITRLREENAKAEEISKSAAQATANSAEMYMELEEKTDEIERQKESLQEAYENLDTIHRELSEKNNLLKRQSEQIDQELKAASDVQKTIMCPPVNVFREMDIAVQTSPASQINGDFYIIQTIDLNTVAVLIADGMGHGVPAALMTIMARAFFQDIAPKNSSPGKIFTELNKRLNQNLFDGAYLTGFLMTYNRITNQVKYASAGHNTILMIPAAANELVELESIDPVLGLIPELEFTEKSIHVDEGDRFYLFTDGIPEARRTDGDFYGMEAFLSIIRQNYNEESLHNQVDSIMNEVYEFCGTLEQDDDRTMIIAEIKAPAEKSEFRNILETFSSETPRNEYTILFNNGVERIRKKDYDNAILIFTKIIEIQPDNYKALYNLGVSYEKINEEKNAIQCWEEVQNILTEKILFEKNQVELIKLKEWETIINRSFDKLERIQRNPEDHMKAEIIGVDITVPKVKLIEFCEKAETMPIFTGLEIREVDDALIIDLPGEAFISLPLTSDILNIDEDNVPDELPNKLYLIFEGLACAFLGNYVVIYSEEQGEKTKVSIIDGMYTSCGNRCMARNVVFPVISPD